MKTTENPAGCPKLAAPFIPLFWCYICQCIQSYLQQICDALEMYSLRISTYPEHTGTTSMALWMWRNVARVEEIADLCFNSFGTFERICQKVLRLLTWSSAILFPCSDTDLTSVLCGQVGNASYTVEATGKRTKSAWSYSFLLNIQVSALASSVCSAPFS